MEKVALQRQPSICHARSSKIDLAWQSPACPRSLFHKQGRWTPEGWAVNQEDVQDAAFIAASRADVPRLLADLHRYQEFCRRLLACYDGEGDVLALVEEVRAALEGK